MKYRIIYDSNAESFIIRRRFLFFWVTIMDARYNFDVPLYFKSKLDAKVHIMMEKHRQEEKRKVNVQIIEVI